MLPKACSLSSEQSIAIANVNYAYEAYNSINDLPYSNDPTSIISQDKYDQLVSLLQQDNLIPSTTNCIISSSNQVTPFARIHIRHSPSELGPSNTCIFNTCVFSYSESNNISPKYWLTDSGANDHICSSLNFFDRKG